MALLHDRRVRYVLAGGISSGTYYGVFWIGWLLTAGGVPYRGRAFRLLKPISFWTVSSRA